MARPVFYSEHSVLKHLFITHSWVLGCGWEIIKRRYITTKTEKDPFSLIVFALW